jgi:hypothetical protein
MSSRSVVQIAVVAAVALVVLRALACLLMTAMPELVAVFVMVVVARLVWFYTR